MPAYHCLNSLDDRQLGSGASTTGTTITIQDNNVLALQSTARIDLDTSGIGTDTITAATIYWYNNVASTKHKDATWDHRIYFYNGSVKGSMIYQNTTGAEPIGWRSHALTSGELAEINKTGDTLFLFEVPDPGNPLWHRTWVIRAWDFVPNGTFSVYLEVTHASGATKVHMIHV